MAIATIKMAKMRSFLTVLGIVIGVVSVVTVVSIGDGVKQQVSHQVDQLGRDLITVRPGDPVRRQSGDAVSQALSGGTFYGVSNVGSLADEDIGVTQHVPGVAKAVPLALLRGAMTVDGKETVPPLMLATTADMDTILGQPTEFGEFFSSDLANQPDAVVIGHDVADRLFSERSPLGKSFEFLGQRFFVRGVMKRFDATPLSLTTDFNDVIFVPYQTAQKLTNKNAVLYQILVKPASTESANIAQTAGAVTTALRNAHGGQQSFAVLRQDQDEQATSAILDLLTKLIAGVAAVSLLVGGIGVMNVMLVSVAERTHEIGLRKALGASNRQIWMQFSTEASVLSFFGGILGAAIALLLSFVLRVTTSLTPIFSWRAMAVAVVVSWIVGVIFGTAPALKAARKDPIESLRSGN
jgi:ABC-type antimicrobial peptide transport system permease subunit